MASFGLHSPAKRLYREEGLVRDPVAYPVPTVFTNPLTLGIICDSLSTIDQAHLAGTCRAIHYGFHDGGALRIIQTNNAVFDLGKVCIHPPRMCSAMYSLMCDLNGKRPADVERFDTMMTVLYEQYYRNATRFIACKYTRCRPMNDAVLFTVGLKWGGQLTDVDLSGCIDITVDGLEMFIKQCPRLKQINLGGCYYEGSNYSNVISALNGLPDLTSVDFDGIMGVGDLLPEFASMHPKLRVANLNNMDVSEDALVKFAANCTQLEEVSLQPCNFGDVGLIHDDVMIQEVVKHWEHLKSIDAIACVNSATLDAMATYCRGLEKIFIAQCSLNDEDIIGVATACKGLKEVILCDVEGISNAAIIGLADKCEHLKVVHLIRVTGITSAAIDYLLETRNLTDFDAR
jgi:hypothetical protein